MWHGFGHSAGVHGGSYLSRAQGWEFVSRSPPGGRERSRSPLRNMSTSAIPVDPKQAGGVLAPGSRAQPEKCHLQHQHLRFKRKFEEIKKRYSQDKAAWIREKELLLREVAEIQAGENRRILLDLRSILEGIQTELKKEEDQRTELHRQYSGDKYAWELERAELKCRIGQLEAKVNRQHVDKVPQDARETLRKEREEQKRLLADTHSAAMDLRKQLENSERTWGREKVELLERFDNERKEWESQLKDMQSKIEQLYQEVKARQQCNLNGNGQRQGKNTRDNCVLLNLHSCNPQYGESHDDKDQKLMNCTWAYDAVIKDNAPSDAVQGTGRCSTISASPLFIDDASHQSLEDSGSSEEIENAEKDTKKYSSTLNAALQEIAKVSEELCNYQEEVRKKTKHKRTKLVSYLQGLKGKENASIFSRDDIFTDEKSNGSYNIFKNPGAILSENHLCCEELNDENKWKQTDRDGNQIPLGLPGMDDITNEPPLTKSEAPPVPPRTSSWYLANSLSVFPYNQENAVKEDSSNCKTQDNVKGQTFSDSSSVRQFETILHENEGKLFPGQFNAFPSQIKRGVGSKCNGNNNRWSCDLAKLSTGTESKFPFCLPLKAVHSDVSIMSFVQQQNLGPKSINGLKQSKALFPNCNIPQCNFADISKATGNCKCNGALAAQPQSDIPVAQTGSDSKTVLNTESCGLAQHGTSMESTQIEKPTCSTFDFSLHSAENSNVTGQFLANRHGSAFRPYMSPSFLTNSRTAGKDKSSNVFSGWMIGNDKEEVTAENDLRPNNPFCQMQSDSKSNIGTVQKMLRSYERSLNPSLEVKEKVHNFTGGKTQQQASLQESRNEFVNLFQILHLEQKTREESKQPAVFRGLSDEEAPLPEILLPGTVTANGMSFSRPARPSNRRLPTRWAMRSPSAPAVLNRAAQNRNQSLLFATETSIM
uniref:SOGA 1/2-like coiled-coil domain-containing protein n=1 Tax=Callorhinchus milii TaxID=7868 RepID=A0A4W3IGB0_CALMI